MKKITFLFSNKILNVVGYSMLALSPLWWDILNITTKAEYQYYLTGNIGLNTYAAYTISTLFAITIVYYILEITSKTSKKIKTIILGTGILLLYWQITKTINIHNGRIVVVLIIFFAIILNKYIYEYLRKASCILLFSSALLPMVTLQLFYYNYIVNSNTKNTINPTTTTKTTNNETAIQNTIANNGHKIIVLVFDELDYYHVFENPSPNLNIKNFKKFESISIVFKNTYSPSNSTLLSIPSIIDGYPYSSALPKDGSTLELTTKSKQVQKWGDSENIFDDAINAGYKVSIAGWTHPYCRALQGRYDECKSYSDEYLNSDGNIFKTTLYMLGHTFSPSNDCFTGGGIYSHKYFHRKALEDISNDSKNMINKNYNQLIYLHIPVPHGPFIGKTIINLDNCLNNSNKYFGNVELANDYLGEIIGTLDNNEDSWNKSTIIITADHWWRSSEAYSGKTDQRVPLLIKLRNQKKSLTTSLKYNNINIRSILRKIYSNNEMEPQELLYNIQKEAIDIKHPIIVKF